MKYLRKKKLSTTNSAPETPWKVNLRKIFTSKSILPDSEDKNKKKKVMRVWDPEEGGWGYALWQNGMLRFQVLAYQRKRQKYRYEKKTFELCVSSQSRLSENKTPEFSRPRFNNPRTYETHQHFLTDHGSTDTQKHIHSRQLQFSALLCWKLSARHISTSISHIALKFTFI